MALVSANSLRDLFSHITTGKTYRRNGLTYTVASKTIYSGIFEGEVEFWIEIELEGPDGQYFVQFDYGTWTLSQHLGSFSSQSSDLHTGLNTLKEGSRFRLAEQDYTIQETAEATVVDVQGTPLDGTAKGEILRYADLSAPGSSTVIRSIEWDAKDPDSVEAFHVESLNSIEAYNWLEISTHLDKQRQIQAILDDETDGEEESNPGSTFAVYALALGAVVAIQLVDGCESSSDCRRRVQSELQAQGIPAGESIRQADVNCSSSRRMYRSTRSFGK